MATYVVRRDGVEVWTDRIDGPKSARNFPAEFLSRPESGETELTIDGEIVATMRTREADEQAVAEWRAQERDARVAYARAVLLAEGVEL